MGGSKRLILKTLGSTTSLWPAAELSDPAWRPSKWMPLRPRDFDTRPGTDDLRISSRSSCSFFMVGDLLSTSVSRKMRLFLSRGRRPKILLLSDVDSADRWARSPSVER